jgi:hypothetical protein
LQSSRVLLTWMKAWLYTPQERRGVGSERGGLRAAPVSQETSALCGWGFIASGEQGEAIWAVFRSGFWWLTVHVNSLKYTPNSKLGALVRMPQFGSRWKCYFKRDILELILSGARPLFPVRWSVRTPVSYDLG